MAQMTKYFLMIFLIFAVGCARNELPPPEFSAQENQPKPQIADERAVKLIKIKEAVVPFFEPMGAPQDFDWLKSFKEPGQTFEEYLNANPTLPTAERKTIYIQPIGEFSEAQMRVLHLTAEYMKAFFNLPVKFNAVKKLENVPPSMQRRNRYEGQRQIKTGYFWEKLLPPLLPDEAAAFICFTNADLYPDENWNFVFGVATLQNRVGVWSLHRFGKPEKSEEDFKLFLARTLKIAMHETGHMFTMTHCTKYECLMSGTNHLGETDRRPLDVCPECMAKISWAMNYEPEKRYRNLAAFWKSQNWNEEEQLNLKKADAVAEVSAD
jgi:archaemetzincin